MRNSRQDVASKIKRHSSYITSPWYCRQSRTTSNLRSSLENLKDLIRINHRALAIYSSNRFTKAKQEARSRSQVRTTDPSSPSQASSNYLHYRHLRNSQVPPRVHASFHLLPESNLRISPKPSSSLPTYMRPSSNRQNKKSNSIWYVIPIKPKPFNDLQRCARTIASLLLRSLSVIEQVPYSPSIPSFLATIRIGVREPHPGRMKKVTVEEIDATTRADAKISLP